MAYNGRNNISSKQLIGPSGHQVKTMLKTQTNILKELEQRFGKMTFDNISQYTRYRVSLFDKIPEKYHETIHQILDIFEAEEKCCE